MGDKFLPDWQICSPKLHALNYYMDKDLLLIAKDEELEGKLQDLGLTTPKSAPKKG